MSTFRESLWTPWGLGSRQAQKLGPWAYLLHRRRPRDGGRASRQDPSPSDLTARDTARPAPALVFDEVATATTGPKTLRHEVHTDAPYLHTKRTPAVSPTGVLDCQIRPSSISAWRSNWISASCRSGASPNRSPRK